MIVISVTPYLIRAYHQWIEDSKLTPNILVECSKFGVVVPKSFIQQEKITLNISTSATNNLSINNESISFKARFNGRSQDIYVPIDAVLSIYANENGEGVFFKSETQTPAAKQKQKKPNLTILS